MVQVLETAGFDGAVRRRAARSSPTPTSRPWRSPTRRSRARWTWRWRWPRETDVDLVVANDPDADRCAAAVPGAARLADAARRRGGRAARRTTCSRTGQDRHLRLLDRLLDAARHGWRRPPASRSPRPSPASSGSARWTGLVFGYEEALGYCVDPEHVKDKDGVSALLLLCELAAAEKAQGRTLVDVLDDLALEHGLHATDQLSVRVTDLAEIAGRHGAAAGDARRPRWAGWPWRASTTSPRARPGCRRPTGCATGSPTSARVIVRPSGTEPKLKCYLEVVVPVDAEAGVDAARISAAGAPRRPARRHQGRRRHLTSPVIEGVETQTTSDTTKARPSTARPMISGQAVWRTVREPSCVLLLGPLLDAARRPVVAGEVLDLLLDEVRVGEVALAPASCTSLLRPPPSAGRRASAGCRRRRSTSSRSGRSCAGTG